MHIRADRTVDCSGLQCPLPLIRARQALESLAPGQILELINTDPSARNAIKRFCGGCGHELLHVADHSNVTAFFIRKG